MQREAVATESAADELVEVVDAEPVLGAPVPQTTVTLRLPRGLELVLPAAVARAAALTVSGFAAGALTTMLGRRGGRRLIRRPGSKVAGRVVASRSFVVDVHMLDKR